MKKFLVIGVLISIIMISISSPPVFALPVVTWNPPSISLQVFPGASLPFNFSSSQNLNDVSVKTSSNLNGLVLLSSSTLNIDQGDQALRLTLIISPNASSGWHNGTITFWHGGSPLQQQLHLNLSVPPTVTDVMQKTPIGEMVTVTSPSYSPYFINSYNMAQYFIFKNGTVFPIRVYYDVFSNGTLEQFTKHATNTGIKNNIPNTVQSSSVSSHQSSSTISTAVPEFPLTLPILVASISFIILMTDWTRLC